MSMWYRGRDSGNSKASASELLETLQMCLLVTPSGNECIQFIIKTTVFKTLSGGIGRFDELFEL